MLFILPIRAICPAHNSLLDVANLRAGSLDDILNTLKFELNVNLIYRISSNRAVNTLLGKNKTGNVRANVTLRRVRVNIVAVGKKYILNTYYECVFVALVIQRAKRMCLV